MTPPRHILPYFYALTTAGGLQFHSLRGSYPGDCPWPVNTQQQGFNIDPTLLAPALDRMLA